MEAIKVDQVDYKEMSFRIIAESNKIRAANGLKPYCEGGSTRAIWLPLRSVIRRRLSGAYTCLRQMMRLPCYIARLQKKLRLADV